MLNTDLINAFADELIRNPNFVREALALRLAHTDFEVVIKKADPLKPYEQIWDSARRVEEQAFVRSTAGKEIY